jgi:mono/diheme cytochrome c family protein
MSTHIDEDRRRARTLAAISLALAAGTLGLTSHPAAAAPVTVDTPEKKVDNLVDPNAEPTTSDSTAKPTAAVAFDSTLVGKGHEMYKSYCQKCHGLDMATPGGGFFDLRTFPLDDKPRFVSSVTNGKRAMPAWGSVFKPADVEALWAYVADAQVSKPQKPQKP